MGMRSAWKQTRIKREENMCVCVCLCVEKSEQRYIFVKQMNGKLYSFRVLSFVWLMQSYTTRHINWTEIEFINNSQPISFYCKVNSCLSIEFCASIWQKRRKEQSQWFLFIYFRCFALCFSFSFSIIFGRSFFIHSRSFWFLKYRLCIMHFACLQQVERFFGRSFGF